PAFAIGRLLVVGREGPAVIGEYTLAPVVGCLPRPSTIMESQCLRHHAPRVVEEVGAKLIGGWIVSDDLKPAHVLFSDTAIGRVHDELATRPPLVDVACEDSNRGRSGFRDSLALGQPSADEDLETVECAWTGICSRHAVSFLLSSTHRSSHAATLQEREYSEETAHDANDHGTVDCEDRPSHERRQRTQPEVQGGLDLDRRRGRHQPQNRSGKRPKQDADQPSTGGLYDGSNRQAFTRKAYRHANDCAGEDCESVGHRWPRTLSIEHRLSSIDRRNSPAIVDDAGFV